MILLSWESIRTFSKLGSSQDIIKKFLWKDIKLTLKKKTSMIYIICVLLIYRRWVGGGGVGLGWLKASLWIMVGEKSAPSDYPIP